MNGRPADTGTDLISVSDQEKGAAMENRPENRLNADETRISRWIDEIDRFNDTPGEGTTRQYLTDTEWNARMYLMEEMTRLGLEVRMDCMGDLFGTLPGTDRSLAPVWTGSHYDTVLHGGKFDGVAGVVAGLESLRVIKESGAAHKRDITVVAYSAEETARFGIGCLGSRVMAGRLSEEDTRNIFAGDGPSLYEELKKRGLDPGEIENSRVRKGDVFCAIEMHIEQNSVLEKTGTPLGIVKAICAPLNYTVTVTGIAAHAGGMPMTERKDAFAAASEMSLALERIVKENTLSEYCTGTVGRIVLTPNVPTVIPAKAEFTVDVRDCSAESKNTLKKLIEEEFRAIAERRGVGLEMVMHNNDVPAVSSPVLIELFEEACAARGIAYRSCISGPFHDSLFVSEFAPIGMLFVPSRDGLSHCPQEWTDTADIKLGTDVMAETLIRLANMDRLQ